MSVKYKFTIRLFFGPPALHFTFSSEWCRWKNSPWKLRNMQLLTSLKSSSRVCNLCRYKNNNINVLVFDTEILLHIFLSEIFSDSSKGCIILIFITFASVFAVRNSLNLSFRYRWVHSSLASVVHIDGKIKYITIKFSLLNLGLWIELDFVSDRTKLIFCTVSGMMHCFGARKKQCW